MSDEQPHEVTTSEPKPFVVHHQGPDDVHECDTWIEAVRLATSLNMQYEAWAIERTGEFGFVATRSWAVPYTRAGFDAICESWMKRGETND